ncbi:MAG: hypothetical protein H6834_13020 [Planctomycetes bacterium]|nr:hypothetical protein [Planctomycetota bacterium]
MKVDCDDFRNWLGERRPEPGQMLPEPWRQHLQSCASCRELEELDQEAWQALDSHPVVHASPGFVARVVRAALGEAARERLRPIGRRWLLIAAAALLLGIAGLWSLWTSAGEEEAQELARLEAQQLPEDFLRHLDLLENLDLLADEGVAAVLDLTSDELAALHAVEAMDEGGR